MASISLPPTARALPDLLRTRPVTGVNPRTWPVTAGLLIALLAAAIRTWDIGAVLATSDQAAMAWMVRHGFGIRWLFAHDYGPVLPLIQRTWAELLSRLGLPIDEAAVRITIAAASLVQVAVTFGLVRRLGCTSREAGLCSLVCALVPSLVCDAHYAWGYNTIWLLTGTVALWATLTWLQEDRPAWLLLAGTALCLHCLSNCFAFALPLTLIHVWGRTLTPSRRGTKNNVSTRTPVVPRHAIWRGFAAGFVLPCLGAIAVILGSWWWTGAGQLGRLAFKHQAGSTGLRLAQVLDLPGMWVTQFGYVFAGAAAVGLIWATCTPRMRVLAVWCLASLLPIVLAVDWSRVGYLASYLIECAYAAGLLGMLWICAVYRRLEGRPVARGVFACAAGFALSHMGLAAADACVGGGRLLAWTGVPVAWGSVRQETGIKAAGWYVRRHVPADAIVLATHTNTGMESPVAEYYCGRAVLADYDLRPAMVEPLVREMMPQIDVLIVEPAWTGLANTMSGFERVATFTRDGTIVRSIYAHRGLKLPHVNAAAVDANERYDREFRTSEVPQVLSAPARFDACYRDYIACVRRLRSQ